MGEPVAGPPPEPPSDRILERDRSTLLLYAALGVLGYLLNGLGSVLEPLQRQLHVHRSDVAFYPSLFAFALIVVGLLAGRALEQLGHRLTLVAAIVGLLAGATLLAMPVRLVTLAGALLLGVGGALMVQVVPAALSERHQADPAVAIGEANAVASFASVIAPAAVAGAVALGLEWWAGYLLPVVPAAAIILAFLMRGGLFRRETGGGVRLQARIGPGLEPGPLPGRWMDVFLAVSVEFCLVFWAADAFREWHHAGDATAPALAAAFLVGMALGRTWAARAIGGRHPLSVVLAACATATLGFGVFWALPETAGAAAGLLLTGAGVALLYPVTLARLIAAWPFAPDRAAARGALASGVAIGVAPLALARVADAIGLRVAYLIVPVLLTVLAAHAATGLARRPVTDGGVQTR